MVVSTGTWCLVILLAWNLSIQKLFLAWWRCIKCWLYIKFQGWHLLTTHILRYLKQVGGQEGGHRSIADCELRWAPDQLESTQHIFLGHGDFNLHHPPPGQDPYLRMTMVSKFIYFAEARPAIQYLNCLRSHTLILFWGTLFHHSKQIQVQVRDTHHKERNPEV